MQTQSGPKNASSLAPVPYQDIDQESRLRRGVSGPTRSPSNPTFDPDNLSMSSRTSSPPPSSTSSRRRKRVISVNSDSKTFSLLPQSQSPSLSGAGFFGSSQFSCTTPESSWGRVSSNIFRVKDRSRSPLTPETPWTPRMGSGVRKLEQLPDDGEGQLAQTPDAPNFSPPLPDCYCSEYGATGAQLSNKNSFQTTASNSTLSERTNFKIYGESSPVRPVARALTGEYERSLAPSSSHSGNYNILGESSSENYSLSDSFRPNTGESNANYVVLGPPSSAGSRPATNRGPRRPRFSFSRVTAPRLSYVLGCRHDSRSHPRLVCWDLADTFSREYDQPTIFQPTRKRFFKRHAAQSLPVECGLIDRHVGKRGRQSTALTFTLHVVLSQPPKQY
ncbi:uncharacterized protein J7T54_004882 [Emericellopsis cladophorae]|uniref:Uncharacterized protein n=1 Tax=Emericellopsis cladophorae TaxID=2686198 RepID=A0A9Q0BB37_9HYPO|nr:uncharacterized protein J7T54_004882 [Emericellopsis cladophorae]KAI6778251.1 hypothetical protein J7T54_004882 [Emericellopsis cladophorae]